MVVVAAGVEEANGFVMNTKLGPGEDLEEFIEGSQAAGECNESIGKVGHHHLTFVHGFDDVERCNTVVFEFTRLEEAGDDSSYVTAGGEGGIGDGAHEAGAAAAVDEGDAALGQERSQMSGGLGVVWVDAAAGGAEDTDAGEWAGLGAGLGVGLGLGHGRDDTGAERGGSAGVRESELGAGVGGAEPGGAGV